MKIGILTGGGDAPGLNAVIRAIVLRGEKEGYEFIGIKDGWLGLLKKKTVKLKTKDVKAITSKGGTILGTSRTNPFKEDEKGKDQSKTLTANIKALKLDCLICIGGDDTLSVAAKLHKLKVPVVGVPKTIDNDLSGTDYTFGFDSAIENVCDSIDKLKTTTEAHHRVMVVETMGRHAGWIAGYGGLAGGADLILVPEEKYKIKDICTFLKKQRREGIHFSVVVAAEGVAIDRGKALHTKDESLDSFGHVKLGGIGEYLAKEIENCTGFETRHVVLGHLQRGGSPTARDRVLATMYGYHAMGLIMKKKFGRMVAVRGEHVTDISIKDASNITKTLDKDFIKMMKDFL